MGMIRSKERVADLGEVFTPEWVVKDMHDLLPKKAWSDPTMIYLEPTCGNGNFLVDAIRRKIEAGLTSEQAVNTTFGMDIMRDNVGEARARVLSMAMSGKPSKPTKVAAIICHNLFVADALEFMKSSPFDERSCWEEFPFLYDDPTGEGLVAGKAVRAKAEALGKALLKESR